MQAPLKVTKSAVRRFLLAQQGLRSGKAGTKPEDAKGWVQHLECIQIDPVAAVERNQHLALFARMRKYRPGMLEQLLRDGQVFEYWANAACVIPIEDYPIFEIVRHRFRQQLEPAIEELGSVVQNVLRRLEAEGPLPSKAFQSEDRVHGYWENTDTAAKTKATSHALNLLNDAGYIHVVRREGNTRYFDLPERTIPAALWQQAQRIDHVEASQKLIDKYIRAYRVFDPADARFGWQKMKVSERREIVQRRVAQGSVVPLQITGVERPYFLLAEDVDSLQEHACGERRDTRSSASTVRFLPPLDNLLWRRDRLEDLFDFKYTWEIYTPQMKRQYGYYAMPILAGDKLIGRIDPRVDRAHARLDVQLLQIEPGIRWSTKLQDNIWLALESFAAFHQATEIRIHRTLPEDVPLKY